MYFFGRVNVSAQGRSAVEPQVGTGMDFRLVGQRLFRSDEENQDRPREEKEDK